MTHRTVLHTVKRKGMSNPFGPRCRQVHEWNSRYQIRIAWVPVTASSFNAGIGLYTINCYHWSWTRFWQSSPLLSKRQPIEVVAMVPRKALNCTEACSFEFKISVSYFDQNRAHLLFARQNRVEKKCKCGCVCATKVKRGIATCFKKHMVKFGFIWCSDGSVTIHEIGYLCALSLIITVHMSCWDRIQ